MCIYILCVYIYYVYIYINILCVYIYYVYIYILIYYVYIYIMCIYILCVYIYIMCIYILCVYIYIISAHNLCTQIFKQYSSNIQAIFKQYSSNIQAIFKQHVALKYDYARICPCEKWEEHRKPFPTPNSSCLTAWLLADPPGVPRPRVFFGWNMRAAGFALLCSLDYEICPEYLVLEASDLHHPKLQAGIHKSPLSLSLSLGLGSWKPSKHIKGKIGN